MRIDRDTLERFREHLAERERAGATAAIYMHDVEILAAPEVCDRPPALCNMRRAWALPFTAEQAAELCKQAEVLCLRLGRRLDRLFDHLFGEIGIQTILTG